MSYRCVGRDTIDNTLYSIWDKLAKKYGTQAADRKADPLIWYVNTARMNTEDLHTLCFANNRQLAVIANRLAKEGTVEEAIDRVKDYLKHIKEDKCYE